MQIAPQIKKIPLRIHQNTPFRTKNSFSLPYTRPWWTPCTPRPNQAFWSRLCAPQNSSHTDDHANW